jgi:hypothetical protein
MTCPSCNQQATSLLRNAVSLQGVTFFQSVRGFLRCQHCGTLLKITNYGKGFWYFYVPAVVVLAALVLGHQYLFAIVRINPGVVWVALVIMISITFTFGLWRHAHVVQVDEAKPPDAG